jgi:glucan-binding YG repeat protein
MNKLFTIALCGAVGLIASLPSAQAQQKTEKACQEEWRANKAENQAAKITEKAYVAKCRGTAAKPEAAKPDAAKKPAAAVAKPEAPTPAATAPKPAQAPAPAATKSESAKPATAVPTGKNQFTTEALAKAHCPSDTVVYVNLKSNIYHFAGHKDYGNLKDGTYMCEKDTAGAGARAAKNEKHP